MAPFSSNFIDYENSVASTPCNSILSTDQSFSSDWPDPPENPICSTEDEAGSIFTDSGEIYQSIYINKLQNYLSTVLTEDVLPLQTTIIPNGTYVIRKGRERKQVFEVPEFVATATETKPSIESAVESNQEVLNIEEANEIIPQSMVQPIMNIPKYRHSIDLAMPSSTQSPKYVYIIYSM